ncbi:tetratricopeptide repeat protein [candidate division WOR-3 bacterium]|uniref:Tetratricopeptide repeat protein n=1 Tax=candidate division WOR-3 bacterium TaxID=2052148 RepID=A0A938BUE3_UNCW3|nr:tetratricopeptide repeat protein [candidate division WOR-3 bacterium]
MRTMLATLLGLALVTSSDGCNRRAPAGSPWTRWGIAKPTTGPDAEAKLTEAHRLFYVQKFDSAASLYRELVESFPQSAEAHLGLSLACRYLGQRDTALTEARVAFGLDSEAVGVLLNYANLMLPMRTGPLADMSDSARYAESERCLLKAAASNHPFNAHAHIELWASYMGQGRLTDARRQAAELGRKHYYAQPLLDFAHNLLAGLDTNAILFTSGDNDTYPLWVLQNSGAPFRPDVTVANLSLLNIRSVVRMMRDSLGLPLSFTDKEIDSLAPRLGATGLELPAHQVIENLLALKPGAGRPVYFAATVKSEITDRYADRLVLEGLVNRVTESGSAAPVPVDRISENLTQRYRLDWPEPLPPWPQNMSPLTRKVAPLAANYANAYARLASLYDSLGRQADAANAWPEAVAWMKRSGKDDAVRSLVEEWNRCLPDDARARKMKAELEKNVKAQ